jgi:hypothetical protein
MQHVLLVCWAQCRGRDSLCVSFLRQLQVSAPFAKLVDDDRDPVVVFSFAAVPGLIDEAGIKLGLLAPSAIFWVQLVLLLAFQTILCFGNALIVLSFVVKRRGLPSACVIGHGVIIPSVLAFPYVVMSWLDIQNLMSRFVLYLPTFRDFPCVGRNALQPERCAYCRGIGAKLYSVQQLLGRSEI